MAAGHSEGTTTHTQALINRPLIFSLLYLFTTIGHRLVDNMLLLAQPHKALAAKQAIKPPLIMATCRIAASCSYLLITSVISPIYAGLQPLASTRSVKKGQASKQLRASLHPHKRATLYTWTYSAVDHNQEKTAHPDIGVFYSGLPGQQPRASPASPAWTRLQ